MPSITPELSDTVLRRQSLPGAPAASTMPTPPSMSKDTRSTNLFCCSHLYPLTCPRGAHEQAIYHFAYYMVNLVSSPSGRTYLPAAHSIILEETSYVIRFERWMNGEKDEMRHFMPHPKQNTTFIELKQATLAASSRKAKWVPDRRYLKFRCDVHQGPWFTCFVLERREAEPRPAIRIVKRKRRVKVEAVVDEDPRSSDEQAYTPTPKSVKRRKT